MKHIITDADIPQAVLDEVRDVVTGHCVQLCLAEQLMGSPERGAKVADFMKRMVGEFMEFNMIERALLVKFFKESNEIVNKTMESSGQIEPMSKLQPQLEEIIAKVEEMAKEVKKSKGDAINKAFDETLGEAKIHGNN